MTPYSLEQAIRDADKHLAEGGPVTTAIVGMLRALLQHEADKEAQRNIERR